MNELTYRTALITGASSGLGRGLTAWFAARGVKVFAAARREELLRTLADECARSGGQVEPMVLDVADAHETVRRIQALDESCGGLDLIIANAGIALDTPAKRIRFEDVERTIQVNVTGAAATLTAVLPKMVERDRGQIVGISSLAAYRGLPRMAAYSASKAFLKTFLEGLRVDLQGTNVRVTSIQPGFVKSEMTARNRFRMPFLMETGDAVDLMGRAISRGDREYAFPWQLAGAMGLARAMPNALWDVTARRLK